MRVDTGKRIALALLVSMTMQATWGTTISFFFESSESDTLKDSFGNDLDASFTFQIGSFTDGFDPAEANTSLWASNWLVFDQAAFQPGPPPLTGVLDGGTDDNGNTVSTQPAADTATSFFSRDAWLWVYNTQDISTEGSEWFLGRASDWTFPDSTASGCCPEGFFQWALNDFTVETPIWGSQALLEGGGTASLKDSFTVQTYVVVPEPGTWVMMSALTLSIVLVFRFQKRRSR